MEKSKVYFVDFKTTHESLPARLHRLMRAAGFEQINFTDRYVAIKVHFGEPGNLAYLRPNYAKVVVDYVRQLGGRPFLTDCNTLYVGGRANGLDHLASAYENGYNPFQTGAHVVIGDGIRGTDDISVPVAGGTYVRQAKIGRAIMDADIFISLSHFKGHELTGFGGALKNIGMGCGSRGGKMEMHSSGKPSVDPDICVGCGICIRNCAQDAITLRKGKAYIDHEACAGCGRCIGQCPKGAIAAEMNEANDILNCKIAEYTKAVVDGRPHFHISIASDISPYCDCHDYNDLPIVPDVGMFASFDPVAIDVAAADAVNSMEAVKGSALDEAPNVQHCDHFTAVSPNTNWHSCVEHAERIGVGTTQYELIRI